MKITNKITCIEKTILKSISFLDIIYLDELPNDEDIIYNSNAHRDNLISELKFDIKKLDYNGTLPAIMKVSKCNYCYPNNKTYTFHNPKSDELILRAVIDKVDDKNYIVIVCENKPKLKLKPPTNKNMPF